MNKKTKKNKTTSRSVGASEGAPVGGDLRAPRVTTSEFAEARFVGINWDAEARCKVHSYHHLPSRKVLTNDIKRIKLFNNQLGEIVKLMRSGNEVRIVDDNAIDAIRFYPCMSTDMKSMFIACSTMGDFRDRLADKKVKIVHRGEEITADEALARNKAAYEAHKERIAKNEVTPDTMVTCPNCGTEFRVGRTYKGA